MATGKDLVAIGMTHLGLSYWNYDNTRFGNDGNPAQPDRMDCSGFMVRINREASNPPPDWAWNSEGLELWGRNAGLEISLADAFVTAGAAVSRWGVGNAGHIALSVGDGQQTIETPAWGPFGHASGTANIQGRDWTNACCFPNIDYVYGPTPDQLEAVAKLEAAIKQATDTVIHFDGTNHQAITWLQIMLNRIYPAKRPLVVDGIYGVTTLHRLQTYEMDVGHLLHLGHNIWPAGGQVGPTVWKWLRYSAKI